MDPTSFGSGFLVVAALTFVAVLLLLESLYLFWRSRYGVKARKLRERLRTVGSGTHQPSANLVKGRLLSEMTRLERTLHAIGRVQALQRYLQQSGLRWSVARLLAGCIALGLATFFGVYEVFRQGLPTALLASVGCGALPLLYVVRCRNRRLLRIERQLPDTLDLMTRALRAGHAFTAGLKMVADEMPEPIAGEFRAVHEEVSFGVSMQQALTNLSERVPLTDVRYFVVAVLVQRESGGNLAEVFSNLSRLVRDRGKLASRVRVLSSEGRMSAWILGSMPFALAGVLYFFNPAFMGPMFTDPIGTAILNYLLGMMVIGAVVMRKIIRIRY